MESLEFRVKRLGISKKIRHQFLSPIGWFSHCLSHTPLSFTPASAPNTRELFFFLASLVIEQVISQLVYEHQTPFMKGTHLVPLCILVSLTKPVLPSLITPYLFPKTFDYFKSSLSLKSEDLSTFGIIKEYKVSPENDPEKYSKNVLRNAGITYSLLR